MSTSRRFILLQSRNRDEIHRTGQIPSSSIIIVRPSLNNRISVGGIGIVDIRRPSKLLLLLLRLRLGLRLRRDGMRNRECPNRSLGLGLRLDRFRLCLGRQLLERLLMLKLRKEILLNRLGLSKLLWKWLSLSRLLSGLGLSRLLNMLSLSKLLNRLSLNNRLLLNCLSLNRFRLIGLISRLLVLYLLVNRSLNRLLLSCWSLR